LLAKLNKFVSSFASNGGIVPPRRRGGIGKMGLVFPTTGLLTRPMQRTAKARFFLFWCRLPRYFEVRQLMLVDDLIFFWVFCVESIRMV
jgi:hypothetical protein